MSNHRKRTAFLPRLNLAGWVSTLLVVAGLILGFTVHIVFLALMAAGAFGPGLLRELGLLRDRDEFQEKAALRAGYRAYLVAGIVLVAIIVAKVWGRLELGDEMIPASMILALLLVVYLMSYLLEYWGARLATFRILFVFGSFWMVFTVLSHFSEPGALLMEILVPLPFFLLAFLARKLPKVAGALLVGISVVAFFAFDINESLTTRPSQAYVGLLLMLPLLISGVALLGEKKEELRPES